MGDRVLIQLTSGAECSPVLYCHWSGEDALELIDALKQRMATRPNDLPYSFARLVQIALGDDNGNLSFGVWNSKKKLTAKDSYGDAGVVLVDVSDWSIKCMGGYLKSPRVDVAKEA